jgi:hypothetical protein
MSADAAWPSFVIDLLTNAMPVERLKGASVLCDQFVSFSER